MSDHIDTREGWRQVSSEDFRGGVDTIVHTGPDGTWRYWVRDDSALPTYEPVPTSSVPRVPRRGDRVSILVRLPPEESSSNVVMEAVLLALESYGVWWSPADDEPRALLTPWAQVEQITASD